MCDGTDVLLSWIVRSEKPLPTPGEVMSIAAELNLKPVIALMMVRGAAQQMQMELPGDQQLVPPNGLPDLKICDLEVPVAIKNLLMGCNIHWLSHLYCYSESELGQIEGFGKCSLNKLVPQLRLIGYPPLRL